MEETTVLTLRVVRSHCLGAGRNVAEGDILRAPGDLTPAEATRKLAIGYVEVVENGGEATAVTPAPSVAPGTVENGDPEVENQDPKPAAKPKPKRNKPRPKR